MSLLLTTSDARYADKVILREHCIIVGEESRPLPLAELGGQQRATGVVALIKAQTNPSGAGIVGVLDQLLEHGRPLRVVGENLPDAASEVDPLAEVLQHRALRLIHARGKGHRN